MWSKVKTRLLSAVVLIALVLIALFLAPTLLIALLVSGVTYAVMYELTKVFNLKEKLMLTVINFIFATVFMIVPYIASVRVICLVTVLYIMSLFAVAVLDNKRVKFTDVSSSLLLVVYSVVLLMHLTFIRKLENGVALLILAFIGAYITDTGAYFTGMMMGKHKLIEAISPNKTVEGAVGGIVYAILGFLIYGAVMKALGYDVNFVALVILSLICAIAAQLGDLSASLMKRSFQVKDFGNIIPGHGGIVDRVDSLLFVAPVVYYFVTFLPVIK